MPTYRKRRHAGDMIRQMFDKNTITLVWSDARITHNGVIEMKSGQARILAKAYPGIKAEFANMIGKNKRFFGVVMKQARGSSEKKDCTYIGLLQDRAAPDHPEDIKMIKDSITELIIEVFGLIKRGKISDGVVVNIEYPTLSSERADELVKAMFSELPENFYIWK